MTRLYHVDDNFFSIYNKLSCYYAGLLAADGCILQNKYIHLGLQDKDLINLKQFIEYIKFTGNINTFQDKKFKTIHHRIQLTSPKWCQDLNINFNITSNKSLTLLPPPINDQLLALSYITGLIDGDGCINIYSGIPIIDIAGTEKVLNWIKHWCDKLVPSYSSVGKVNKHKNSNCYSYRLGGPRALRFAKLIRELRLPFFKRKWDNFGELDGSIKVLERKRSSETGRFI